ncbi:MAG: Gfo/Idh/MocA family oxidoreductase [Candidatus Marinimicrobia bacterium]|nr:Gfo/Idh/MocA family oxidoreductase [Candidatus Neomarinimicrobiota bacterium]
MNENKTDSKPAGAGKTNLGRREILKSLATLPVVGVLFYNVWKKLRRDALRKTNLLSDLVKEHKAPAVVSPKNSGKYLRIGIIGYGGRGQHLVRGAGFAAPDWVETAAANAKKNKLDKGFKTFMQQEDLNLSIVGVCDLFDLRAETGLAASKNEIRPGGKPIESAKRYKHYTEMLENDDIDAVIIATPDHWHAKIVIDAARAGKHVYCEKAMTRIFQDAIAVYDVVKETGIVFQLGHQNRQVESLDRAKEIVQQGLLGPINLVEVTTNRNSPWGAWVWTIHPEGNKRTIDWDTFQEPAPTKIPFGDEALKRFFRWRMWFDYGTGLSGDLFSHEFDAVNQVMELGVPKYVSASGGIYFYKDGRDVPDVFHATFEYPDKNLTLLYSATLSSNKNRGNIFMGHDATMQIGGAGDSNISGLIVTADSESTRYKERIESGIINTRYPIYSYTPGSKQIDGVTSATAKYFANKGLVYTYREGKRVDPTHLHIKDWVDSIRENRKPKCDIEVGFHESLACHMATESYLTGRRVEWDPVKRRIV